MNFLWYDLETYGTDQKKDRIAQFAAIRTDEELNIIGDECSIFSEIPDDYLPDPQACLVHGFTPRDLSTKQLRECKFAERISQLMCEPGTCSVGFNNNFFDDEFIRFLFYRNLRDPYAWHWRNGNSRWDILNLARTISALRPNSIKVKTTDTGYSFKLQDLAVSNQVDSGQAHDALSDVKTTLALARIFKRQANDIFCNSYKIREKAAASEFIKSHRFLPVIFTSRFIPSSLKSTSVVVPICSHPSFRDHYIAIDLRHEISALITEPAEELKKLIFSRNEGRTYPQHKPRLHVIKLNGCPSLYDIELATEDSLKEIGLSKTQMSASHDKIKSNENQIISKIQDIFRDRKERQSDSDPEEQLYDGLISDEAREQSEYFLSQLNLGNLTSTGIFNDRRLKELAWRYLQRNYPHKRSSNESKKRWDKFVQQRLASPSKDSNLSQIQANKEAIHQAQKESASSPRNLQVLTNLLSRVEDLEDKYMNNTAQ